jgi:glycosyltransferase involved in cell wall biosynthesis
MVDQNKAFLKIVDSFAKTANIPSIPIIKAKLNFLPKITIAIPTYKRPKLLKLALDSALNQADYTNFEVLIVDNDPVRDCATEKMMSFYQNNKISYYKNESNLGMFGNWNRCIELAKGEYVTILNDDDTLREEYLKSVKEVVSNNPRIDAILTGFNFIDSRGKIILEKNCPKPKTSKIIAVDLLFRNINPGSLGILFSKKSLIHIGGYDETYYPSSDYMFLVKYLIIFENVLYLNKVLTNYRISVNESNKISTLQGFFDMDKKIRKTFIFIYPKLKKMIEMSFPILEFEQFKSHCEQSKEFNEINSAQLILLNKKIGFQNKIAFRLLFRLSKLRMFNRLFKSYNIF